MTDQVTGLVQRAQQGDRHTFAQLFQEYQRTVFNLLTHLTGDTDLAADLAQDTFVKAWEKLPRLRNPKAFGGWLRIIATNIVRDNARRKKPERSLSDKRDDETPETDYPDNRPNAEQELILSAQRRKVREAVLKLPEAQRSVILLYHFAEYPVAQIAEELDIPVGTVLSRLSRAREALKRHLWDMQ